MKESTVVGITVYQKLSSVSLQDRCIPCTTVLVLAQLVHFYHLYFGHCIGQLKFGHPVIVNPM
jgi:hypothetical protein